MDKELTADARCLTIASRQHSVISLEQAVAAGLSRHGIARRIRAGEVYRIYPSVYRVGGAAATWEQRVMAAQLSCGRECLASHRSAAALLQFDGSSKRFVEVTGGSLFETRLNRALRRGRVPLPHRQVEIFDDRGFIAQVDFAYPEVRFIIEADSYKFHSGRAEWQRDINRRNRLTVAGWSILQITWSDLRERPEQVAAQVRDALENAGWFARRRSHRG